MDLAGCFLRETLDRRCGALKMGTIVSPYAYDAAACNALQSAKSAPACDLALRFMGGCLRDFGGGPVTRSIAALSINPEIGGLRFADPPQVGHVTGKRGGVQGPDVGGVRRRPPDAPDGRSE